AGHALALPRERNEPDLLWLGSIAASAAADQMVLNQAGGAQLYQSFGHGPVVAGEERPPQIGGADDAETADLGEEIALAVAYGNGVGGSGVVAFRVPLKAVFAVADGLEIRSIVGSWPPRARRWGAVVPDPWRDGFSFAGGLLGKLVDHLKRQSGCCVPVPAIELIRLAVHGSPLVGLRVWGFGLRPGSRFACRGLVGLLGHGRGTGCADHLAKFVLGAV